MLSLKHHQRMIPLFLTVLLTQFGSSVLTFFLSLTVLMQSKSPLAFSQVVLIGSVISLISSPLIGLLVDRYPKRRLLIIAQIISICALIGCFFLSQGQAVPSFLTIVLIVVLLNLMDSVVSTTLLASAVYLVDSEEELGQFNGILQTIDSSSSLLGPLVAGAIYPLVSLDIAIGLEVVLELLGLISLLFLSFRTNPLEEIEVEEDSDELNEEAMTFGAALSYLFQQKILLCLLLGMLVMNFLLSALTIGFPTIVTTYFAGNSLVVGILEASIPLGMIVAGLVFMYRPLNPDKVNLVLKSWVVNATCLLLIALSVWLFKGAIFPLTTLLILINLLMGLALTAGRIPILAFFQKHISPNKQGRIFAILDVLVQISMPVGVLIFGFLFEYFSVLPVFIVSGLLMIVFVAYLRHLLNHQN